MPEKPDKTHDTVWLEMTALTTDGLRLATLLHVVNIHRNPLQATTQSINVRLNRSRQIARPNCSGSTSRDHSES
jgi:hypothetical protein